MNAPILPHNQNHDSSPADPDRDSTWSDMNGYNNLNLRPEGPYAAAAAPPRGDSMSGHDGYPRMNDGQSRSNGMPPNSAFGPPTLAPSQRRRPSEAGSQPSSRAASVANSRSSDGTISDQHSRRYRRMEMELHQHYTVLRAFLKGNSQQLPPPNKARDKLLRLSPVQFHELSTDVFDELQRRQAAAPLPGREPRQKAVPPFLQPIPQFHEKRNQARQKLSSLQTSRFRDLSTDVFRELERRFPHFANPEGGRRDSSRSNTSRSGSGRPPLPPVHTANGSMSNQGGFPPRSGSIPGGGVPHFDNPPGSASSTGSNDLGRPMPKQFQSNTITPNKSTMVEDDEDDDDDDASSAHYGRGRSSDAFGLESVMTSPTSERGRLGNARRGASRDIKSVDEQIASLERALRQKDDDMSALKQDLDRKVEDAERLNRALQEELDQLQANQANVERDLRSQIQNDHQTQGDGIWKSQYDQLQRQYTDLQSRLEEQQKITEEVNRQGELFLSEMRALAEGGASNFEREEKLQLDVHRLEEELKEWKARYAKAKTQLRSARAVSGGIGLIGTDAVRQANDNAFRSPTGVIKDVHVSQFQIAIDELLHSARSTDSVVILGTMREVVQAVRNITLDVDGSNAGAGDSDDDEMVHRRTKLRSKVSATANNVITATKSFAAAGGLSPVSLLDAAASHLTAAVVDLVRLVKVRPMAPEDETDEDGFVQIQNMNEPVNDAGYFNMTQRLRGSSLADSEYSALSSPPDAADGPGLAAADTPATSHSLSGHPANGLGIQTSMTMGEDATELQELKIYLENQTDLLAQTIQALVTSIRNEESMASVQGHISAIVDIVENVLSAAEGAMEDPSSYQAELRQKAAAVVKSLTDGKDNLVQVGNDPKANATGPSSKTFTQRLPPLAFQIARETKELVSRIESVEAGKVEDDFS